VARFLFFGMQPKLKTMQELLNEIVNLTMYRNEIVKNNLYLDQEHLFLSIQLDSIKKIESNEGTYKIMTPIVWITIWKNVKHIHITIFEH
jgi:hypothetical protein